MNEAERKQRNTIKLQELHPAVRVRMEAVLREMESFGYRPRIQEAWRSMKDQLAAYNGGKSKVKFGFHNVTANDGTKEALAADVWDDNRPFNTKTDFMLHLLAAAEKNGLTTGIRWSLSDNRIKLIEDAIEAQDWKRPVWVGWDPLHVEVAGITVQEAQAGKRPAMPNSQSSEADEDANIEEETENRFSLEPVKNRVENLETGQTKEYELSTALRPINLLAVPYISQLGAGTVSQNDDCGVAAVVMILAAYTGTIITPDTLYGQLNTNGAKHLNVDQVCNALGNQGVIVEFKSNLSVKDLFGYLTSGIPCIVPVNYKTLHQAGLTEKTFTGPHFSVATGMDLKNIYLHDPLFTDPEKGNAHVYPLDIFLKAWTDTTLIQGYSIPQRSAIIPATTLGVRSIKRIRVTADRLNVRQGPGTNHAVLDIAKFAEEYTLLREANGWGEINPGRWINLSFTENIPLPSPSIKFHPEPSTQPVEESRHDTLQDIELEADHGMFINVSLSSSIPQNPTGPRAAQYLFKDTQIPSIHRNLCGDIALSMIYETATRQENTLGHIYKGSKNTTRKPTSGSIAYELAQQFANTFPKDWKASCLYLSYHYYFEAGNASHLKSSPGALKKSLTQKSHSELKELISKMVMDRTFVIAGVNQNTKLDGAGAGRLDPKGVGHWVVVTGISQKEVFINNPFMNRKEIYTWEEFLKSFSYWILQLLPPASFRVQAYSGPVNNVRANLEQDRNKARAGV